jgi:tryptophan 2-monooxygenase
MKTICTARLILRPYDSSHDESSLCRILGEKQVMRFLYSGTEFIDGQQRNMFSGKALSLSKFQDFARRHLQSNPTKDTGVNTLIESVSGSVIGLGCILPCRHLGETDSEILFILEEKEWNKGFATEIGAALLQHGLKELGLRRLIATAHEKNKGAARVLKKLGMVLVETIEVSRRIVLAVYAKYPNPWPHWRFRWPNTADFNFNYYHLLDGDSIGKSSNERLRIAIIGAGVAGLTVGRELFRSGYRNIDIYEASDRLGGRTYSEQLPDGTRTVYEFGAMRLPFFTEPDHRNCVLDYYTKHFKILTDPFPNPGSTWRSPRESSHSTPAIHGEAKKLRGCTTGIYVNKGRGPFGDRESSLLDIWKPGDRWPPEQYRPVHEKWLSFKKKFDRVARKHYERGDDAWQTFWQAVAAHYWNKSFRDLVRLAAHNNPKQHENGDLGGMGMNSEEERLFSVIGAGDGGWGAFYDICALWVIRTLLCGYGENHRLMKGKPKPPAIENWRRLPQSKYLGVQTLAECLFFEPAGNQSLNDAKSVQLFLNTQVTHFSLTRQNERPQVKVVSQKWPRGRTYDAVIITTPTWAGQHSISSSGIDERLPKFDKIRRALESSHWIASCKVFFPLTKQYWKHTKIPQVLITDEFFHDVYGYAIDKEHGVLLASYTWEDQAERLLADNDAALTQKILNDLDELLMKCENIKKKISPYVKGDQGRVWHWRTKQSYRGCARLGRAGTWEDDYALLSFNQEYSAHTGLYLAGESFSVEGGWLEPALRMALDAVIHVIENTDGKFCSGFDFTTHYPKYDVHWKPDPTSPYLP